MSDFRKWLSLHGEFALTAERDFPLPLGGVRGGPEVNNISILIGGGANPVSIMKMAFECLKSRLTPPSKTKIKRVASPPLTPPKGRGIRAPRAEPLDQNFLQVIEHIVSRWAAGSVKSEQCLSSKRN